MPKAIKSATRKLLFTVIDKFIDHKRNLNLKSAEKILQLDSILSLLGNINNEETKHKIVEEVKKLKTLERNEMATCETHYLEKISSTKDVCVKTLELKLKGLKIKDSGILQGKIVHI